MSGLIFMTCEGFNVTIIHTNDIHSHVEQMDKYSGRCKADDDVAGKCFGGVARRVTIVRELRANHSNSLLLAAGDQFQGTQWFNIYEGSTSAQFMNHMGYDVMVC